MTEEPRSNRPTPRTTAAVEAELRRRIRTELTQARSDADPFALARIEVDVEVLGLEHLEVQLLVVNLVLTKILCRHRRDSRQYQAQSESDHTEAK